MLMIKTIMSQVQEGDWFVTIDLKDAYFTSKSFKDTGGSFGLPLEGRLTNTRSCPSAWLGAENVYEMHGCCTGPFEAPGHSCTELSGRLAHSGSLQGASESSQGYRSRPHPFSWPHKPPRRFKVAHPGQACASSSPLVPRQVPLFEGGSRSGSTEPGGRFSVETEAQAGGMDVEPSDGIPDLGSVWQSEGGPLCFSRVIPVPALVLPEFPDDSGHRCVRPPMAECQSVRVSANKADSGSTMQSEGERCPSPSHSPILALPDLVLGANSPCISLLGRFQSGGTYCPSFRARSGILSRSSGSCGYGPYRAKGCDWWFACRSSGNHSQCQSPLY